MKYTYMYQRPNTNIHVFHYDTLWSGKCVPAFHGLQFPSLSMLSLAMKGLSTLLFLCLETKTNDTNIWASREVTGRWRS
jgi:hypothetical protein